MIGFKKLAHKITNLLLALFIISAQLFAPISAIVPAANAVHPAPVYECVDDTAGQNDEPGQKDLNTLCVDDTHLPQEIDVTWNWDETGTPGNNTMDACSLFDTDGDGYANYSVCVVTNNDPAVETATVLYSCGDDKPDRCTAPVAPLTISGNTACSVVSPSADDPFNGPGNNDGDDYPNDTKALCTLDLSDVGGASTAELIDVCSYPSQQPNSDPSDCVIIKDTTAFITLIKQIVPETDDGLFNLLIDGQVKASDVSDNESTGVVNVEASGSGQGTVFTLSETAGTNTSLSGYTSTVQCTKEDKNGTPTVGSTVNGTSTTVALKPAEEAVCVFTNTRAGSITIVKDAIPNDAQDFSFTATGSGVNNFTLDDDANVTLSNSATFNNLSAGTYTFTEAAVAGWYLDGIECPNITETKDLTTGQVSLTIAAGQNITCTFTNRKLGQIIVTKQTNPNGDPQLFSITATGTNTISGNATRDIIDDETETFTVRHGEYDVTEQDIAGWAENDSACQNLVIDGNTPLVNGIPTRSCTITNTKLAVLIIIKDALPNHEQDFTFTTSGTGLSNFSLDDDSDGALPSQQTFSNLTPNQQYSVTEQATPGWSLTGLSCNDVAQQGSTATVTPTPGQTITCTFTNTKLISVSGTKFEVDAGATDGGLGTVLGGWTIYIDSNNNGELDLGELSDVTDENGNYSFSDLLYGTTVTLREVLQAGWTQIFGPDTFTLDSANDVTGKDFGNFENATISGFKWNDKNANDVWNEGTEEKLNGWTITLYNDGDDEDTDLDDVVTSTITAGEGSYSFTNLAPGTYVVCETQQGPAWVQTFPNDNGCHTIVIDESGETEQANFGNQGRGTITVVKNVDTDGDGQINDQDVTTWTWDIDAAGNFATGSGNSQGVAAGDYTVSEDQQTNYHVTVSSCTGETTPQSATTSLGVTVSPGEHVTCTFTNTRDTGTIEVIKNINPTDDEGTFDLRISGVTKKEDASHGDTTGAVQVVTGNYDVSELAGDVNTSLSDYSTTLTCTKNGQALLTDIATTDSDDFSVATGDTVVCTFTNTRLGHIIVEKQTDPDGSTETFEFDTSYDFANFTLSDGQQNDSGNLLPGTYSVAELAETGWDLTSVVCSDQSDPSSIDLNPGETVTCVFTNTQDANIIVVKQTDPDGDPQSFSFTASYDQDGFSLSDGQQNDSGDLDPGTYSVSETVPDGWDLDSATCSDQSDPSAVSLQAGETVTCTFNNQKDAKIIVVKQTDPDGSTQSFDFTASYDGNGFSLSDGQSDDSGDLDPGTYSVSETVPDGWELKNTTCDDGSSSSEINLSAGEIVTCTFTNEQDAHIIVVKQTNPDGSQQSFNFTASYDNDGFALSDGQQNDSGDLDPGTYSVSETVPDGWDLDSATCSDQSDPSSINLSAGETVTCTFTNEQDANIIVTKQTNPDGHAQSFSFNADYDEDGFNLNDGQSNDSGDLDPGTYSVSENVPAGWSLESAICDNERDPSSINLNAGETVNCTFTNLRDASLLIEKSNNRPNPTVVGDTVTYTLTVTVPFDSGPVYDATVTDLPPEGFNYIPGSETASKPGAFLEHPYASPGIWSLGDLSPGDVVVLTYKTLIANSASAGTYPDLAFAEGCDIDIPVDSEVVCSEENAVLANVTNINEDGTPFVGTEVTIKAPQVLAANTTVLVNTGAGDIWRNLAVGTLLMGVGLATLYRREKKGYTL
jgi:uncharacterized repeat protein (TIGR01451 family)